MTEDLLAMAALWAASFAGAFALSAFLLERVQLARRNRGLDRARRELDDAAERVGRRRG